MNEHAKLDALWIEYDKAVSDLIEQKEWAMEHGFKVLSHAYAVAQNTLLSEMNLLNKARACYSE